MLENRILITGCAGFIGYHLCRSLVGHGGEILGIDNINSYYDENLKYARLKKLGLNRNKIETSKTKILKSDIYRNFHFSRIDISNRNLLKNIFSEFKPHKVVNLAAQAGVRYSIENPYAYLDSNLIGFLNIIELCKCNDVKGLIYASSSSVYGGNTKTPFCIEDRVDSPLSFYAATKRANELIAHSYSNLYGLHTTGLRYFSVYGPWGRPDMAPFIFTKKILADEKIPVFNNGKIRRDFTYIDDIILGTKSAIQKNFKCKIFNLGNNKSEDLMYFLYLIEKTLGKKSKVHFLPMQLGDILESYADIKESKKMLGFRPSTNLDIGVKYFIKWYLSYYNQDI